MMKLGKKKENNRPSQPELTWQTCNLGNKERANSALPIKLAIHVMKSG
jgi:hypothetical protein